MLRFLNLHFTRVYSAKLSVKPVDRSVQTGPVRKEKERKVERNEKEEIRRQRRIKKNEIGEGDGVREKGRERERFSQLI